MRYRKLRIAWSVGCGIVTVLLIVLWVRSYQKPVLVVQSGHSILVMAGTIEVDKRAEFYTAPTTDWQMKSDDISSLWKPQRENHYQYVSAATVAIWWPVCPSIACAAAPWFLRRFSLRTLLIATTLVAVVLGLAVWAAR
jgi:hypothetical protein